MDSSLLPLNSSNTEFAFLLMFTGVIKFDEGIAVFPKLIWSLSTKIKK